MFFLPSPLTKPRISEKSRGLVIPPHPSWLLSGNEPSPPSGQNKILLMALISSLSQNFGMIELTMVYRFAKIIIGPLTYIPQVLPIVTKFS
jgi:hypothetical protein